jgi:hypothetical protein
MTVMNHPDPNPDDALLAPLLSDGRHLLTLGTLGLLLSGGFAIFLGLAGQFLPHDTDFLGMTAGQLCGVDACRVVHFMIHDRVAFGGTLIALSVLYLWIIAFPLRDRQPWAWWTLLLSNVAGFASFGLYLGFGYLDRWHGLATLFLMPCFAAGLAMTFPALRRPRGIGCLLLSGDGLWSSAGLGRRLLLASSAGLCAGGAVIAAVGTTVVFVPQDLAYLRLTPAALDAINPRLIPLIAHDRAGFGSGVLNAGFLMLAIAWCGTPSRSRWQAMAVAVTIGFGTAIGVHPAVGYNSVVHLAPAVLGAIGFGAALGLTRPARRVTETDTSAAPRPVPTAA